MIKITKQMNISTYNGSRMLASHNFSASGLFICIFDYSIHMYNKIDSIKSFALFLLILFCFPRKNLLENLSIFNTVFLNHKFRYALILFPMLAYLCVEIPQFKFQSTIEINTIQVLNNFLCLIKKTTTL